MNLRSFMHKHETEIEALLQDSSAHHHWQTICCRHQTMIKNMQHERLVHLLVTLFFALFLLIATAIALLSTNLKTLLLMTLFFIMNVAYVRHYFFLENTIQHWYILDRKLEKLSENATDT